MGEKSPGKINMTTYFMRTSFTYIYFYQLEELAWWAVRAKPYLDLDPNEIYSVKEEDKPALARAPFINRKLMVSMAPEGQCSPSHQHFFWEACKENPMPPMPPFRPLPMATKNQDKCSELTTQYPSHCMAYLSIDLLKRRKKAGEHALGWDPAIPNKVGALYKVFSGK